MIVKLILQHISERMACGMLLFYFMDLQHCSVLKEVYHLNKNKWSEPKQKRIVLIFFGRIKLPVVCFVQLQDVT
jgi:hypothetical protein